MTARDQSSGVILKYANVLGAHLLKSHTDAGFELGPGGASNPFLSDSDSRADRYLLGYISGAGWRLCESAPELANVPQKEKSDIWAEVIGTNIVGFFGQAHAASLMQRCLDPRAKDEPKFASGLLDGYESILQSNDDKLWKHLMRRRMDQR